MGFLADKRILITGLLSKHSIAYGIAKACHREGAQLAFTYQNERFIERVSKFADEFDSKLILPCDVSSDEQIVQLFDSLGKEWDGCLDGLVHSIAFAPTEALEGDFLDGISRESFRIAHDVSSYSFPALVKAARPMRPCNNPRLDWGVSKTWMNSSTSTRIRQRRSEPSPPRLRPSC